MNTELYLCPAEIVCCDNDNDAFVPELWVNEGLMQLEENMVVANLVHRDFENVVANFGDTVNTRRPGEFKIRRKNDSTTSLEKQDAKATNVPVTLNQWFYNSFVIKDGERIRESIVRARSQSAKQTSHDEKRLQDIRRKIERGTENLALAGKQDFAAISKLLTKWREEEAEIMGRIERRRGELEPLPEALKIIRQFGYVKGRLQDADRAKLQYALQQTISSIRIGTRMAKTGEITCREHFGELRFHEALLPGKVINIPDEAIGQRKIWREIGELCRQADRPLHLKDFCQHIGTKDASRAAHHVRKAEKAGLMRKIGWYGGWVAMGEVGDGEIERWETKPADLLQRFVEAYTPQWQESIQAIRG